MEGTDKRVSLFWVILVFCLYELRNSVESFVFSRKKLVFFEFLGGGNVLSRAKMLMDPSHIMAMLVLIAIPISVYFLWVSVSLIFPFL